MNMSPEQEEALRQQLNDANSNREKQESIKNQMDPKQLEKLSDAKSTLDRLDAEKKMVKSNMNRDYRNDMRPNQKQEPLASFMFDMERDGLKNQLDDLQKSRAASKQIVSDSYDKSARNLHPLTGERSGQMAFDLPDQDQGRGQARAIVDVKDGRLYLSDVRLGHDYDNANRPGERPLPAEPGTGKLPNQELFARTNKCTRFDEDEDKKDQ